MTGTDLPWLGDACSLVDAFRSGERSPTEELEATLGAIAASDLGAFVWLDEERAVMEALTGIKRAGADLIITYHAKDAVRWLG